MKTITSTLLILACCFILDINAQDFNSQIPIEGTIIDAKKLSKEKSAIVIFFKEGESTSAKPEDYTKVLSDLFLSNEYTFFPSDVLIVYEKALGNKSSWVALFLKGNRYLIPDPKFLPDEREIMIPEKTYKPQILGYSQNIIQITRDFYKETFVDQRDGRTYESIKYNFDDGTATEWMIENLNYKNNNSMSYANSNSNRNKYGLLYRIMNESGQFDDPCPNEWELPTLEDWNKLVTKFGGRMESGNLLKSQDGWKWYEWENDERLSISGYSGNNYSGFNILPAGEYKTYKAKNEFGFIGLWANFWTKTLHVYPNTGTTYYRNFNFISFTGNNNIARGTLSKLKLANDGSESYYSIRCIRK